MYWDVHCHLTDKRWGQDLAPALEEALERGISGFVLGGVDPDEWGRQLDLCRQYPELKIATSFGLHPQWVCESSADQVEEGLNALARVGRQAHLFGEMGLDARKVFRPFWEQQMEAFRAQLELASFLKKPVVLHVVRCHSEALQLLLLHREGLSGGFVHAFHGDPSTARQYLDLGLAISVGGGVTHPSAHALREVVRWLPKEAILLETDSPDQKVKNWPSSLHRPVALWDIAEHVAELRGETAEQILKQSAENIERLLGERLSKPV